MEIREILQEALDFYQDHDWIQGEMYEYENGQQGTPGFAEEWGIQSIRGACLEGACCQADFFSALDGTMRAALHELLAAARRLYPRFASPSYDMIFQVNDDPSVTREDIMLIIKHAIETQGHEVHR